MICPRCSNEISENETLCPYCFTEINTDLEFNDYKKDGFVRILSKEDPSYKKRQKRKKENNKYLRAHDLQLVVISVVFLLSVAVVTIFGYKALQYWSNDTPANIAVPVYVPNSGKDKNATKVKNTVTDVTIKNIYGSWKHKDAVEKENYAIPYFSFAADGAAQYDFGSFSVVGYYEEYSTDTENRVYIEIENQINGVFKYNVTGNADDGYELTLKNIHSGFTYVFVTADAKTYTLDPIKDFEIDKAIIGNWESKDQIRGYSFTQSGEFIRRVDDQVMRGVWTKSPDQENVLILKYMESSISTIYVKYAAFEDVLVVNDIIYYPKK